MLRVRDVAAVGLLSAAAHLPALFDGFTWLDHGDIEHGYALAAPSGWLGLFAHGFARSGFYRPLVALSLSIDALAGNRAWPFHLTNLLTHGLAASLLAMVAVELGVDRIPALLGAALFGVHPATAAVADQISFRAESLVAVGLLLALWGHRRERAALAALGIALAGLSKETGLALAPLWLGVISLKWPSRRLAIAEVATWSSCVALRLAFAPAWHASYPAMRAGEQLATRAGLLVRDGFELIGLERGVCDDTAILGFGTWWPWLGIAIAAALIFFAVKNRLVRLAAIAMLPALSLVPVPRFWSPHYLYLPLMFLALACAQALARAPALVLAGVAFGSIVSFMDAPRFHDDVALFQKELAARPSCREGWLYVGDAQRTWNNPELSLEAYRRALAPTPGVIAFSDRLAAAQNLGVAALQFGQLDEAERAFRSALAAGPPEKTARELRHDLAATRLAQGHADEAAALIASDCARADAPEETRLLCARVAR